MCSTVYWFSGGGLELGGGGGGGGHTHMTCKVQYICAAQQDLDFVSPTPDRVYIFKVFSGMGPVKRKCMHMI